MSIKRDIKPYQTLDMFHFFVYNTNCIVKGDIFMQTWIIKYYITEGSYRSGVPAFKEEIKGDRNYVVTWAQNKVRCSQFKFYDIEQK